MIRRICRYVKVSGYELDAETKEPKAVEHVINGRISDTERAKQRALREFPGFMPTECEFHRQMTTMTDSDYFKNARFGEDKIVNPVAGEPVENSNLEATASTENQGK